MHAGQLPRRVAAVALALLLAAAFAPATASAQSDPLGCTSTVVPDHAGPVGHTNMLQITIADCPYAWDTLNIRLRDGASSTFTEPPVGFACDDEGFDVVCGRRTRSTAGVDLGIRPQCPRSGRLRLMLVLLSTQGGQRNGAVKSFPCTRPPVRVLAPPARQSLSTALRRGVLTRFSCRVKCSARVALIADTVRGEKVGVATLRRSRAGTTVGRVRIKPAFRRRYQRRRGGTVTVSVTVTARTGEQVTLGHSVRLR